MEIQFQLNIECAAGNGIVSVGPLLLSPDRHEIAMRWKITNIIGGIRMRHNVRLATLAR